MGLIFEEDDKFVMIKNLKEGKIQKHEMGGFAFSSQVDSLHDQVQRLESDLVV